MSHWFTEEIEPLQNTIVTLGNFDGLHLGHQQLKNKLRSISDLQNLTPVIISYLEHPGHYIYLKNPVKILTPKFIKKELLIAEGFSHIYFLNFNSDTAKISPHDFLRDAIIHYFHPKIILTGYDSHFGFQRQGTPEFLIKSEKEFGFRTIQLEPVTCQNRIVSSTAIRQLLAEGGISEANDMLGRPYRLYGKVVRGRKFGKEIGFPTINLLLKDADQLIPKSGVYLSAISLDGISYFGLTNIGLSPTLKNTDQVEIETYILDFDMNVYDAQINLDLLEFIREEQKFASREELRGAIQKDMLHARQMINDIKAWKIDT